MITGQGLLIMFAGYLEHRFNSLQVAWSATFFSIAFLFISFFVYHKWILPHPLGDRAEKLKSPSFLIQEFYRTFLQFFRKKRTGIIILFLLFYRLGEAQLAKIAPLFLLDKNNIGGLGLSTTEVGFVYGTIGITMLTIGGILGGVVASKYGLKFWLWWMALALKLPDIVYVYFAYYLPDNFLLINICIGLEQFGYGFGFTAYILYMIYISEGRYKTAHYAIATGFMALGMMIPGMFSGWLQELIGYQYFFIWVLISTIPGLILLKFIPLDPDFGKRN
jgi:PAT family beta-lactamase induction signal transducer AmpG